MAVDIYGKENEVEEQLLEEEWGGGGGGDLKRWYGWRRR